MEECAMLKYRALVVGVVVLVACLAWKPPASMAVEGPVLAIDFETSAQWESTQILSCFEGDTEYLYAFLVVQAMPGNHISGFTLDYEIKSSNAGIKCLGFVPLGTWKRLHPEADLGSEVSASTGAVVPVALGYWVVRLGDGADARGEITVGVTSTNGTQGSLLIDGDGNRWPVIHTCRGVIGKCSPRDEVPTAPLVRRDCLGRPLHVDRCENYEPGVVLAGFVPGTVDLAKQATAPFLDSVSDQRLRNTGQQSGLGLTNRLFPSAKREKEVVTAFSGDIVTLPSIWDIYRIEIPMEADPWEVCDSLEQSDLCIYAHPNCVGRVAAVPDDSLTWNIDAIGMPEAWNYEVGQASIKVGIIDTGLDYRHPEFGGTVCDTCKVAGGEDFYTWEDIIGTSHGTHVAGIVAGLTNNAEGCAGIAGGWMPGNRGCTLYGWKVGTELAVNTDAVALAIESAVNLHQNRVLNASITITGDVETVEIALARAIMIETVFVAARGNNPGGRPDTSAVLPACFNEDWVISVGASTSPEEAGEERRVDLTDIGASCPWGSYYGKGMDFLAPGQDIYSTVNTGQTPPYGTKGGTSMAAPHVAGLAALMLSHRPNLHPNDIQGLMAAGCTDILVDVDAEPGEDLTGYDIFSGHGRICADSSLAFLDSTEFLLLHGEAVGGFVCDSIPLVVKFMGSEPCSGETYCLRYDVRRNVMYNASFWTFPRVWGRGANSSTGWSAASPNYPVGFCRVVPGSEETFGCQLQSFVYLVPEGGGLEWYPCPPESVVFAYSVLGVPAAGVEPRGVRAAFLSPEGPGATPNPFRGEALIAFSLPVAGDVSLSVYDAMGRLVTTLRHGRMEPGQYETKWGGLDDRGRPVGPGVYFLRLQTAAGTRTQKVILVR
jgi:hypothetical protein